MNETVKLIIEIPKEDYALAKKQVAEGITNPLKIYISHGIPLDDVKAEIEESRYITQDPIYARGLETALEIIDKYIGGE